MSSTVLTRHSYVASTIIIAGTAALASAGSLTLALPVRAMFVGWIAFFTRGLNARSAIENPSCVGVGLVIGVAASLLIPRAAVLVGPRLALPLVVFGVALVVVATRGLTAMNNLLGDFLGLVMWFAAHLDPSLEAVTQLFTASSLGSLAGWISHKLPSRLMGSVH